MNSKINKLLNNLNDQLSFINLEINNESIRCEHAIEIILKTLEALKTIISKTKFKTDSEEIKFFKEIKPQFTSKLIFYNTLYKIVMKKPNGGTRIVKKYYNNELIKLKAFFNNELEFYKYFRSGSIYLDHKYFLRSKFDIKMSLDSYYFETDRNFATSHDFKVAKILANDLIQLHLENQLIRCSSVIPFSSIMHNQKRFYRRICAYRKYYCCCDTSSQHYLLALFHTLLYSSPIATLVP